MYVNYIAFSMAPLTVLQLALVLREGIMTGFF